MFGFRAGACAMATIVVPRIAAAAITTRAYRT
jgi:hypothetical protein